ncbi:hypothetical protein O9K51_10317 [Purpureocillium lavendulum]|uniref:Uncharacterized protein n=1 Tax=Purpureocillium lavendulum TaxID=1247861 RepID=A0AB34FCM9_9HYPO|nr:hypothetical protein O9K51_10317 [Purpureocillium lavendulum]
MWDKLHVSELQCHGSVDDALYAKNWTDDASATILAASNSLEMFLIYFGMVRVQRNRIWSYSTLMI